MMLRPHRRNLVLWRQSAGLAGRNGAPRIPRHRRTRRWIRRGALLTLVGLLALARGVRARWRPILAGVTLTVAGSVLRGPGVIFLLPGLMLLMSAPLLPGRSPADRSRRSKLERELASYSTPAERRDLEATLDQYPDAVTRELRDILASQAMAAQDRRFPAVGRH
jgi:hypothetical protein